MTQSACCPCSITSRFRQIMMAYLKEHMRLVMEYIDEWNFVDDYPEERLVLWRTIEDLLLC